MHNKACVVYINVDIIRKTVFHRKYNLGKLPINTYLCTYYIILTMAFVKAVQLGYYIIVEGQKFRQFRGTEKHTDILFQR